MHPGSAWAPNRHTAWRLPLIGARRAQIGARRRDSFAISINDAAPKDLEKMLQVRRIHPNGVLFATDSRHACGRVTLATDRYHFGSRGLTLIDCKVTLGTVISQLQYVKIGRS